MAKHELAPVHFRSMNPSGGSGPYPSIKAEEKRLTLAPTEDAPAASSGSELDQLLVRRMQTGDEAALGEFYDRWFPIVSALIARMLKSASDVEDVVEEAFWQAWRQAQRYSPDRGSVQTWLLTIARSRALDRLRASRRAPEESIDDAIASGGESSVVATSSASDPSVDVELAERRQLVLAALSELPREQREVVELGYFGGLSHSEIAERTGQPLGTIKTRMRLALQKLRDRLSSLREGAR